MYTLHRFLFFLVSFWPLAVLPAQTASGRYSYYAVRKEAVTPNFAMPTVLPNGELWLGSYSDGLFRWENGALVPQPEPNKVPNHHRLLNVDKEGNVWIQMAEQWIGRLANGKPVYYDNYGGALFYPLEAGMPVLRQHDSLFLVRPESPWPFITKRTQGAVFAANLTGQSGLYYTVHDSSAAKRLPRFFRQAPSGAPVPLPSPLPPSYLTAYSNLEAVVDPTTFILTEAVEHRLIVVRDGKVQWDHRPEGRWVLYQTDGRNFWAVEQCWGRGPVRDYRIWEWQGDRFVPYTFRLIGDAGDFGSITRDAAGNIWFSTQSSLYRLFPSVRVYDADETIPDLIVSAVEDADRRLFLASYGDGATILDRAGNPLAAPPLLRPFTHWMMGGSRVNDEVWLPNAYGRGIFRINRALQADTIFDGHIFFYLRQNSDGSVAAGSNNYGLFYLPPHRDPGMPGQWKIIDSSGFAMKKVLAVADDTLGRLWCINRRGIAVYDPARDTAHSWIVDANAPPPAYGGCTVETDAWGSVWFGTQNGLRLYRPSGRSFRPETDLVPILPRFFDGQPILSLRRKNHDTLVVASGDRLYLLDLGYFYSHGAEADPAQSLPGAALEAANSGLRGGFNQNGIFPGRDGGLYVASDHGLHYFRPEQVVTVGEKQELRLSRINFIDRSDADTLNDPHGKIVFPFSRRLVRFTLRSWSSFHFLPDSIRLVVDGRVRKTLPFTRGSSPTIDYRFDWPGRYTVEFATLRNGTVLATDTAHIWVNFGWAELFALMSLLFVLAVLVVIYYVWKRSRFKSRIEKAELTLAGLQFQLLAYASQLEPHFLRNVLQPMQGRLCLTDPPLADALSDVNDMLRILLLAGKQKPPGVHSLYDEMALTRKYLQIQTCMFTSKKFTYELPDPTVLEAYKWLRIPVISIQLFVENAFIHAIETKASGGRIVITLEDTVSAVQIMVDDNGPGPEKSKSIVRAKSADHTGRGLTLMRTLFDMLNLHNEHKLNFELIDKAAHGLGAGARVIIEFPKHFHFENGGSIAS